MRTPQFFLVFVFLTTSSLSCKGQKSFGSEQLILKQTISLPGVRGRIDHMDVNLQSRTVYMAALGNNSLEAIDIINGKILHSVKELNEPQDVVYIPVTNEIMVANGGNGKCTFFNATNFQQTAVIDLGADADDVRYDSTDQRIYVGYGDGGIAIIDARKHQKIADVKLPAHPEGFQLDKASNKVFVNVPGANQIDIIDLTTMNVTAKWETEFGANFPMAIDKERHTIFIGYRHPAKVVAIDERTGKTIAVADLISDVDDIYFNSSTSKLFASGGGGAINIFSFTDSKFNQVANIPTKSGARTSLLIPQLNTFVLAERACTGPAQLQVYSIKN